MEYYSVRVKNEKMLYAAVWVDLVIIILSEVKSNGETQISYVITFMWNIIYEADELIFFSKTETNPQAENKLLVAKWVRRRRDKLGVWD